MGTAIERTCGWCEEGLDYDGISDIHTIGITLDGKRWQVQYRCFTEFGEIGGEIFDEFGGESAEQKKQPTTRSGRKEARERGRRVAAELWSSQGSPNIDRATG